MEKVSQTLRRVREQQKISREEAAQRTHIPLSYLLLLEGEKPDTSRRPPLLPDPFYLIPYLQRYASFLDIDANSAVAHFTNELQDIQTRQEKTDAFDQPHPRLGPVPQRSRAISLSIVLASILVTLALIGQYSDLSINSHQLGNPVLDSPSTALFEKNSQPPTSPDQPEAVPSPSQSSSSVHTSPSLTRAEEPQASTLDNNLEVSSPISSQLKQTDNAGIASSAETIATSLSSTTPSNAPPSNPRHHLLIQAKETTWIRVLIEGQSPREMILKPGQSAEWTSDTGFSLTLGNAGGVTLTMDGQELPILGKSGQVIRNIRLPFASTVQQG